MCTFCIIYGKIYGEFVDYSIIAIIFYSMELWANLHFAKLQPLRHHCNY